MKCMLYLTSCFTTHFRNSFFLQAVRSLNNQWLASALAALHCTLLLKFYFRTFSALCNPLWLFSHPSPMRQLFIVYLLVSLTSLVLVSLIALLLSCWSLMQLFPLLQLWHKRFTEFLQRHMTIKSWSLLIDPTQMTTYLPGWGLDASEEKSLSEN